MQVPKSGLEGYFQKPLRIGSIKANDAAQAMTELARFQFHIGSIKARPARVRCAPIHVSFNSTLVRSRPYRELPAI